MADPKSDGMVSPDPTGTAASESPPKKKPSLRKKLSSFIGSRSSKKKALVIRNQTMDLSVEAEAKFAADRGLDDFALGTIFKAKSAFHALLKSTPSRIVLETREERLAGKDEVDSPIPEEETWLEKSFDFVQVKNACLIALVAAVQLSDKVTTSTDKRSLEYYVKQAFYLPETIFKGLVETAEKSESLKLELHCRVQSAKDIPPMDANGKSDPYCRLCILSRKHQDTHAVRHGTISDWLKSKLVTKSCVTNVKNETLEPVWNEEFTLPLTEPNEDLLVIEVWDSDESTVTASKIKGIRGLKSFIHDLKEGDDFIGRAFYPVHSIPLRGEGKTLTLYSRSMKHQRGSVAVRLSVHGVRGDTPIETRLREHTTLYKGLVKFESRKTKEGLMIHKHQRRWDAKLSDTASTLLLQHALFLGLSDLQRAAV